MYCLDLEIHTHCHDISVQSGTETWATEKTEKKNKDASGALSGAATRRRDISCPTALRVRGRDGTGAWHLNASL